MGKRNGLSTRSTPTSAVEWSAWWAPQSNDFDYTKHYLRSLPVRLAVPFTGAISRTAAMGSEVANRVLQAETPAERHVAAVRAAKFVGGVGLLALGGSAFRQALYDWKKGKDFDVNKALESAAFDAISMGGFPYSGRIGEKLVHAFERR